jgi:plasmid maintenance system antidote protein VapI
VLREEFLVPLGLTQSQVAKALHTSFRTVNELVNEKRGITPQLWLNLQNQYDLYRVMHRKHDALDKVEAGHFSMA